MTEQEWSARPAPWAMVTHLLNRCGTARTKAGRRKLRLFGCACCRRVWHLLTHPTARVAVETAERFADGQTTQAELDNAARQVEEALDADRRIPWDLRQPRDDRTTQAYYAAWIAAGKVCGKAARAASASSEAGIVFRWLGGEAAEVEAQARLLRCTFGNPFRPAAFSSTWRTGSAVSIARQLYESRDFLTLPILADALQDAGCDNDDILDHCRAPGPHDRGCWVGDQLLQKE